MPETPASTATLGETLAGHKRQFWPNSPESAVDAIRSTAWVSAFVAVVTSGIAVWSIAQGKPIAGYDGWALVDGGLFALFGFKLFRHSYRWAYAALGLWAAGILTKIVGPQQGLNFMAFLILAAYVAGARAAYILTKDTPIVWALNGWQRLWLVISLLFTIPVTIIMLSMADPSDDLWETILSGVFLWLTPMALLYGFGVLVNWVVAGFRQRPTSVQSNLERPAAPDSSPFRGAS